MTGGDIARNGASRLSETRAQEEGTVGSWSQACIKILQYSYRSPACPPPEFSTALVACPPVHLRLFCLCIQAQIHTETTHTCQTAAQRHRSQSSHLRTALLEFIGLLCLPHRLKLVHLALSPKLTPRVITVFLHYSSRNGSRTASLPCNYPVWKACCRTVFRGAYIS